MKIGFVVAADRYTGAAAVAELMCRAARTAGADGTLLFRGGRNLEHRLAGDGWAHPRLEKERSPAALARNLMRIRGFSREHDAVIAHLPHDHALCIAVGVHRRCRLIRSYRHPKHLGSGPWQRCLHRRTAGRLLAHTRMQATESSSPTLVLPVPVEDRFHRAVKPGEWREWLGIGDGVPVLGVVGKIAPDRGFRLALETTRLLGRPYQLMVVGHGESLPGLQRTSTELWLGGRVHWLGYRDGDLPALYAAMDVVLVPAAGSDHGHRAVSEAQACGRPVVAADLDGMQDLIRDGVSGVVAEPTPAGFAAAVASLVENPTRAKALGRAAADAVQSRRMAAVGSRLVEFVEGFSHI